jgi:hypothetical protein
MAFRCLFSCAFTSDGQKHFLLPKGSFPTSFWLCLGLVQCLTAAAGEIAFECIHEVDDVLAASVGFRLNGSAGALCVGQVGEGGLIAIFELLGIELSGFLFDDVLRSSISFVTFTS